MLRVGITGGIGSGKSTVCEVFKTLGIPIFNADLEARLITDNDDAVSLAIKRAFGESYFVNGKLDRPKMAQTVFSDPESLKVLNGIIHPAVGKAYESWLNQHIDKAYTIKEAAIMFESNSHLGLDKVIVVTCPEHLRIKRVMKRDGVTEDEVRQRISKQMPEREKVERADYIINNDENQLIIPQVLSIHQKLIEG